jgi:hypothetical protein
MNGIMTSVGAAVTLAALGAVNRMKSNDSNLVREHPAGRQDARSRLQVLSASQPA